MVTQLKIAIAVILAYLNAFGFARGVMRDVNKSDGKRFLLNFLDVDNDPVTVARYQLFPRNEVLTVTVTGTACAPMTSQSSSVASSMPVNSSSPSSPSLPISSSLVSPSTPVTLTPPSSAPLPSTYPDTLWTPTPSSTTPIFSSTPSSMESPSPSSSSSVSSPVFSQTIPQPAKSETTGNAATTTTASSTSTTAPPEHGIASRQTGVHISIVLLLALVNVLAIHGLGSTVVW